LHPRVLRLIAKGREFLVIGIHEPYYQKAYGMIRDREMQTGTWTEGDEVCYVRAVDRWQAGQDAAAAEAAKGGAE
jgi:hypothetical protein